MGKVVTGRENGWNVHAFEVIFRNHYKGLVRFSYTYVKSTAIAEELVQDLFLKLWERPGSIRKPEALKSYLYKSARNLSLDYLRHNEVVLSFEKDRKALFRDNRDDDALDDQISQKIILKKVEDVIRELPEKRRAIFILSRYEGMSHKEISEVLNISVNTVETQISRALHTLKERFSHYLIYASALLLYMMS